MIFAKKKIEGVDPGGKKNYDLQQWAPLYEKSDIYQNHYYFFYQVLPGKFFAFLFIPGIPG